MRKPDPHFRNRNVALNIRQLTNGKRQSYSKKKLKIISNRKVDKPKKFKILAPKSLALNPRSKREEMLIFFSDIKNALGYKDSKIHINFGETNSLLPCGTLYFRAHMSLLLERYKNRINCSYPKDDVVGQLFQHIKLLEKMGLSNKYTVTADNVRHWHSVEGTKADTSKFENLLHSYEDELAQPMRLGLYESMSEAITNCVQHAYETTQIKEENQKWWMFSTKLENVLTVAIYDSGIGIAESLRIKPELMDIMQGLTFRTNNSDKKLLKLAVGSNKTKTKLSYRGKGLPDMMHFVASMNVGGLLIHSNHGTYMYDAYLKKEHTSDYVHPIKGTLIQWTLPLIDEV